MTNYVNLLKHVTFNLKTATISIGLLGTISLSQLTLAQEADGCYIPPGTTPIEDPTVTADQAAADESLIKDFTLEVSATFKALSSNVNDLSQIVYFGCELRLEDSAWSSDTVYPMMVSPFGRIIFHTEDMSLSGRLIDPAILSTIYVSLGVARSDIANLRSSDPATVAAARMAILNHLATEPDAAFDATRPIPGVRPGIPGAKGYVSAYVGRTFRIPLLVIGGFDLTIDHVAEEDIDYGNPSITADQVVDRPTLKQFVTDAGNYFLEAQADVRDALLASTVKVAMRDPEGPWRHGSVYIYILDLRSNICYMHAANPNRWEFRSLTPVTRDVASGEFIVELIVEAARSSSEGGFVRYYFDDPTNDNDSADSPKLAFAREFSGTTETFDGRQITSNYIVVSGIYLTSPEVVKERQNRILAGVLPQVMRTMTASSVDAISDRLQFAYSNSEQSSAFNLGGRSILSKLQSATRNNDNNGVFDGFRLIDDLNFHTLLPTNNANGVLSGLTFWGNVEQRSLADDNLEVLEYDGTVNSINLGIDREIGENLIGGVSFTRSNATLDYTDPELVLGEFSILNLSINPYLGWQKPDTGLFLWAAAGFGFGEVGFEESTNSQESDLSQRMIATGIQQSLYSSESFLRGGTTSLQLKGETAVTEATVDDNGILEETSLSATRTRLSLEGMYSRQLASNALLTPAIEVGWRHDGGDGDTGGGFELEMSLGYTMGRLALKLDTQTLLSHSELDDYDEWKVGGMVTFLPENGNYGFSMSAGTSWGIQRPHEFAFQALDPKNDLQFFTQFEDKSLPSLTYHTEFRYDFKQPTGLGVWTFYRGYANNVEQRSLELGATYRSVLGIDTRLLLGYVDRLDQPMQLHIKFGGTIYW